MADRRTLVLVALVDNFGRAWIGPALSRVETARRGLQTVTKHGKPAAVALMRRSTLVALATVRNFWQRQQTRFESFEI